MNIQYINEWNFEADEEGLLVCWGEHERSAACTMERLSPQETLDVIIELRTKLLSTQNSLRLLKK